MCAVPPIPPRFPLRRVQLTGSTVQAGGGPCKEGPALSTCQNKLAARNSSARSTSAEAGLRARGSAENRCRRQRSASTRRIGSCSALKLWATASVIFALAYQPGLAATHQSQVFPCFNGNASAARCSVVTNIPSTRISWPSRASGW